MKGRNTVEEVLSVSAEQGYTVFFRNREESNVLSDIVIAHSTSIAMIRTWPYVLIMDTTYNMPLLKVVGMTPTRKNFTVSEHSVLKLWLSTCHGDLDTMFLNIDSLIEGQIAEIKTSLKISKLREKYGAKTNPILKNISNIISHLALKKIWLEIKRAGEISGNPLSKCGHYLRKSHGLPCACELVGRGNNYGSNIESQGSEPSHQRCYKSGVARRSLYSIDNPSSPETPVTKRRRKIYSTKRDKSYWEQVSIAHRKIGKSSGSGSGSESSSGSGSGPSPCVRGRLSHSGRGRSRGHSSERSNLSFIVNSNSPSMPFPFRNVFPGFVYEFIQDWKNVVGDGNWSTTVLPLYSNMDCTAGTLCIGFISDQHHFIQQYHRDVGVSGWADHYYEWIAE
ncbi:hypothetical protein M9H77_07923 [Catharanthus roseus]|uniref:Uncharacterized protein n=1 Tax=Catharanthus roseus TaxID=4058 RepID=A0ACC0BWB1_CATRO|nr:hypothetical protein M9H77_07923 [Catharanthus roseus]